MAEAAREIGSAAQLAAALQSGESNARVQLYRALDGMLTRAETESRAVNPELAEVLHARYRGLARDPERDMVAALLLRVPGDASLEVAREEFFATGNETLLVLAAQRLSRLPAAERAALLGPCVMDGSHALRCRAAANLLDDCFAELPAVQALRVALVSDHALRVPPVNADTLEVWLAELAGPYPRSARAAVLAQGDDALVALLDAWDRLSPQLRAWVLPACAGADDARARARAGARIRQMLSRPVAPGDGAAVELLLLGLECLRRLDAPGQASDGAAPDELRQAPGEALLAPWYEHPDPRVRAAAVAAGAAPLGWAEMLAGEPDAGVRAALAERMGCCGGAGAGERLGGLLRDPSWRVRARAAVALAALGPGSRGVLEQALAGEDEGARVAAAQGLVRLGNGDWPYFEMGPIPISK